MALATALSIRPIHQRPPFRHVHALDLATRPENVYRHVWRRHDLVMWDNRATLHRGRPWDGDRYRRVMHRTTVAGDGPTA
jgi:alpha-ketoglutarate-dependent taurine dioxygenase